MEVVVGAGGDLLASLVMASCNRMAAELLKKWRAKGRGARGMLDSTGGNGGNLENALMALDSQAENVKTTMGTVPNTEQDPQASAAWSVHLRESMKSVETHIDVMEGKLDQHSCMVQAIEQKLAVSECRIRQEHDANERSFRKLEARLDEVVRPLHDVRVGVQHLQVSPLRTATMHLQDYICADGGPKRLSDAYGFSLEALHNCSQIDLKIEAARIVIATFLAMKIEDHSALEAKEYTITIAFCGVVKDLESFWSPSPVEPSAEKEKALIFLMDMACLLHGWPPRANPPILNMLRQDLVHGFAALHLSNSAVAGPHRALGADAVTHLLNKEPLLHLLLMAHAKGMDTHPCETRDVVVHSLVNGGMLSADDLSKLGKGRSTASTYVDSIARKDNTVDPDPTAPWVSVTSGTISLSEGGQITGLSQGTAIKLSRWSELSNGCCYFEVTVHEEGGVGLGWARFGGESSLRDEYLPDVDEFSIRTSKTPWSIQDLCVGMWIRLGRRKTGGTFGVLLHPGEGRTCLSYEGESVGEITVDNPLGLYPACSFDPGMGITINHGAKPFKHAPRDVLDSVSMCHVRRT